MMKCTLEHALTSAAAVVVVHKTPTPARSINDILSKAPKPHAAAAPKLIQPSSLPKQQYTPQQEQERQTVARVLTMQQQCLTMSSDLDFSSAAATVRGNLNDIKVFVAMIKNVILHRSVLEILNPTHPYSAELRDLVITVVRGSLDTLLQTHQLTSSLLPSRLALIIFNTLLIFFLQRAHYFSCPSALHYVSSRSYPSATTKSCFQCHQLRGSQ